MIVLEIAPCTTIDEAITEALANAKRSGDRVEFQFNSVRIIVAEDSDHSLIWRDWNRARAGCLGKTPTIGPYPKQLTQLDRARDRWTLAQARLAESALERRAALIEHDAAKRDLDRLTQQQELAT